jgi:hypothetical protein
MSIQEPKTCRACHAVLLGDEPLGGHCWACLLDAAIDQELTGYVDRFDHYELETHPQGIPVELGRGAMGVTYRAIDTVLGHPVALKVIDSHLAADPPAQERFLSEARAAARLRHPNVASVFYDFAGQGVERPACLSLGAMVRRICRPV